MYENVFYKGDEYSVTMLGDGKVLLKYIGDLEDGEDGTYIIPESTYKHMKNQYMEQLTIKENNTFEQIKYKTVINNKVDFFCMQYLPLIKLLEQKEYKSILIADQVGVGKTIEGGIILSEFQCQKENGVKLLDLNNDKVLIVSPDIMKAKWRYELRNKFGIIVTDLGTLNDWDKININLNNFIFIVSYDVIAKASNDVLNRLNFKMILMDEAHRVKNINKTHQNIELLLKKSKYKVMLSATPENGKKENEKSDTANLLKLLFLNNQEDKPNVEDFLAKENIYHTNTKKVALLEKTAERKIKNIDINDCKVHIEQKQLYEKYLNVFSLLNNGSVSHCAKTLISSSFYAGKEFIDNIINHENSEEYIINTVKKYSKNVADEVGLYDEDEIESEKLERVEEFKKEIQQLKEEFDKIILSDNFIEWKINELLKLCEEKNKMVIFAKYKATIKYISSILQKMNINFVCINAELSSLDRERNIIKFQKDDNVKIVLIGNVGCEGLDFDMSDTIVNYDMDYNPVVLEQRVGRVDRLKQKKDEIYIYNFYNETVDKRLYEIIRKNIDKICEISGGDFYEIVDNMPLVIKQRISDYKKNIIDIKKDITKNILGTIDFNKSEKIVNNAIFKIMQEKLNIRFDDISENIKEKMRYNLENNAFEIDENMILGTENIIEVWRK